MNGMKFPTLQAIARDLLTVPVTSVASESSFSIGGRLLDPHRSTLHSTTVESILCTKSWVHDELKIDSKISATALEGCFTELIKDAMENEDED
ncbi:Putative AC transposase [Linum perenne]